MSISADHWANVVSRVRAHAKKLYPNDEEKQQELGDHLLALGNKIATDRDLKRLRSLLREEQAGRSPLSILVGRLRLK